MNCPECFGFRGEHAVWCPYGRKIQFSSWFIALIALLLAWSVLSFCSCSTPNPKHQLASTPRKMRVTMYHRWEDKFGSRTASGIRAKEGVTVAADPSIPLGTPLRIPELAGKIGDGYFVVQDRGRLIKGAHLDIYVECSSRREARRRMRELSGLPSWMEVIL